MAGAEILSPEQLRAELKQGRLAPVYLLAGADTFRAERTARWLREKSLEGPVGDLNVENVWADEVDPGKIAQIASAFPMFGGQRFVWVRHAEALPSGAAIEPLLSYIASPVESTTLVLTSAKLDKRIKLTSAVASRGRVVEFAPLSGQALAQQVHRQAQAHGVVLSPEAAALLLQLVGDDLQEIDQELAKLAILVGDDGAELGPDSVRQLVARSRAIDGFEIADAMDPADPRRFLDAWTELRTRRGDAIGTGAILGWRLRQLVQLRTTLDEGLPGRDAAARAGISPWQARRLIPLCEKQNAHSLHKTLDAFRVADRRAKSSSLGAELAYDLAVLDWCHRAFT